MGSAAYRSGSELRSAASSAAYRSGGKLEGERVHDYRNKGGVIYSEIMLPKDAPPEYKDRGTLWRAVDNREKRKDARLAKEINVALPKDFSLQEQIEVLREYIQENFINKGVIADLNIHNNNDGNPHAHIMLTTRRVTPDGFKGKNRELDSRQSLMEWRKSWADCNNRMFERKGLDERLDHRTLKAQGIDREPTIHLGHEAWALEKRGIKTAKGDYNREIQRRNAERAALKEAERSAQTQERREDVKAAELAEKLKARHEAEQNAKKVEGQLRAAKATLLVEAMRERQTIIKQMNELKVTYSALDKELNALKAQLDKDERKSYQLSNRAERLDENANNIKRLQGETAQLQVIRQSLSFRDGKKKKETDEEIRQAKNDIAKFQSFFRNPNNISREIEDAKKELLEKQREIRETQARIQEITKQQNAILLQYQTQKLLNDIRPDSKNIDNQLENTREPPKSVYEQLRQIQLERCLNTVSDENFRKIINTLPPHQAQELIKSRQAKEQEKSDILTKNMSKTIEKDEPERTR